MTTHELKTWPVYFDAIERGEKTFEVRRDDRGFQKGDYVYLVRTREEKLYEVARDLDGNPRRGLLRRIGWILTGGQFGIEPGYVAFSLEPTDEQ